MNSITFTWQDNANNESGYEMQRKRADGTWAVRASLGANPDIGPMTYTDTGLGYSGTYCYRVRVWNAGGEVLGAEKCARTLDPPPPPTAPSDLTITDHTATSMALRWMDNSTNEEKFEVQWSSGDGRWINSGRLPAHNGTGWMTTTQYGLGSNMQHCFRIRAFHAYGESYSNEVCGRTDAGWTPPAGSGGQRGAHAGACRRHGDILPSAWTAVCADVVCL